jgi:type IV secretory pathway VirD2 relaxase
MGCRLGAVRPGGVLPCGTRARLRRGTLMSAADDDDFRARPGPPRGRGATGSDRFVSRVLREVSKAGAARRSSDGARGEFGRGRVAARLGSPSFGPRARRVVIKSRFVVLKRASPSSVATHLRYIARDGVTPEGEPGRAYGPQTDAADLQAFEARGRGDRHQFRMILSVEDAVLLQDARGFTRDFMRQIETDLETSLDWVAVDHWDTDNPHTHIVLRGRAGDGRDLVISPDYMAHGMRARASALATEWLGPRTELEIHQSLLREVGQERLTSLDRSLLRQALQNVVDLGQQPADGRRQAMLRARLQKLEALGLAERLDINRWRFGQDAASTLVSMGERGDILRSMHKALRGNSRELAMPGSPHDGPVVGRIVGKGLSDELHDRGYLVVDALDGRAHYVRLPAGSELDVLPLNAIGTVRPDGRFQVDSDLPMDRQVHAQGATWLDRQLVRPAFPGSAGFGAEVRRAMERRVEVLEREGLATRSGGKVVLARDLLSTLCERELAVHAARLHESSGAVYRSLSKSGRFTGIYRQQLDLVSGRFALLEAEGSFCFVPWRPSLGKRLGQTLTAVVRDKAISLHLDHRQRGLQL